MVDKEKQEDYHRKLVVLKNLWNSEYTRLCNVVLFLLISVLLCVYGVYGITPLMLIITWKLNINILSSTASEKTSLCMHSICFFSVPKVKRNMKKRRRNILWFYFIHKLQYIFIWQHLWESATLWYCDFIIPFLQQRNFYRDK